MSFLDGLVQNKKTFLDGFIQSLPSANPQEQPQTPNFTPSGTLFNQFSPTQTSTPSTLGSPFYATGNPMVGAQKVAQAIPGAVNTVGTAIANIPKTAVQDLLVTPTIRTEQAIGSAIETFKPGTVDKSLTGEEDITINTPFGTYTVPAQKTGFLPAAKQIAGQGLKAASWLITPGALAGLGSRVVSNATIDAVRTGLPLTEGALQNVFWNVVKEGAKSGAVVGSIQGLGESLWTDKNASDTIKNTVIGALFGGALGATTAGAIAGFQIVKNKTQFIQDQITKELVAQGISPEQAKQFASSAGFIKNPLGGGFNESKYIPTSQEISDTEVKGVVPPELIPLTKEAQKYSSAEEFVKAQEKATESIYHATTEQNVKSIKAMGVRSDIDRMYFASDPKVVETYGKNTISVPTNKFQILPSNGMRAKGFFERAGVDPEFPQLNEKLIGILKSEGYDGIKYPTSMDNWDYEIFNKEKINKIIKAQEVSKSQLTDFYNRVIGATGKDLISTPPEGMGLPQSPLGSTELPQSPRQVQKVVSALPNDIAQIKTNTSLNIDNLNISKSGKDLINQVAEDIKPQIEERIGGVLTNKQVLEMADASSKVLQKTIGQDQTASWEAAMLKARQELALAGQTGTVDRGFIETFLTVKTQGTDIARKLQSLSIGADPKESSPLQAILSAVLDVNSNVDEVLNAAKGVDFNDAKQAAQFYRQFIKPSALEWLDLVRYNSMLTSPKTHIVNTFSNTVNSAIVAPVEKAITGGVDFLGSTITGNERKYFAGESGAYLKGYFGNVSEAFARLGDVLSGERASTNLDTRNIPLAPEGGIKGVAEKVLSFPLKMLEGMDQFFTALTAGGESAGLRYRASKGVEISLTDLGVTPSDMAAYRLFRQELFPEGQGTLLNAIDELTSKMYSLRNSSNPVISLPARFSVPFIKTPMNIFKQGLEYSPIGFATLAGAAEKSPQIAKALIGSAVFATGAMMIASNRLTWAEPTNETEKSAFKDAGMQPYSLKIGNNWYSYQKLAPGLAFPLSMIALINQAQKDKKLDQSTGELILSAIAKYGEFLADQSYAKSFGDLISAISGGESSIAKLASNYPQQLIPFRALGGWMAKLLDDVQRKPDPQANFVEKQVQLLMLNIPGLSQNVPARTNSKGEPIPANNNELNAVSPVQISTENPEKAAEYQHLIDIKKLEQQVTAENNLVKDVAQSTWNELSNLPGDQIKARLKEIAKTNPTLAEKIIALAKEDTLIPLNPEEKKLKSSMVETRARFIVESLKNYGTPDKKKAYLKNLSDKKILTADVFKRVQELLNQ